MRDYTRPASSCHRSAVIQYRVRKIPASFLMMPCSFGSNPAARASAKESVFAGFISTPIQGNPCTSNPYLHMSRTARRACPTLRCAGDIQRSIAAPPSCRRCNRIHPISAGSPTARIARRQSGASVSQRRLAVAIRRCAFASVVGVRASHAHLMASSSAATTDDASPGRRGSRTVTPSLSVGGGDIIGQRGYQSDRGIESLGPPCVSTRSQLQPKEVLR